NFWKPYMCILATYIYVVKEKVSLAAEGQFIPPPIEAGDFLSVRLKPASNKKAHNPKVMDKIWCE
ncbi:MAG: hypothetical protein IIY78_05075, partial [Clostridia bacterium]|nr:hypothetical protein [Clostridia bacterium]